MTFYANGSASVLDPAFLFTYLNSEQANQYYNLEIGLNPGEGYTILSQEIIDHL